MSGALKPIGAAVNKNAAKNFFSGTMRKVNDELDRIPGPKYKGRNVMVMNMRAAAPLNLGLGNDYISRHFNDTEMLRNNPTTPFSKNDAATVIADPLNLTGEPAADAERKAAEEASAIISSLPAPRALPDAEAIARERRKRLARQRNTGRSSTIMSDVSYGSDSLSG
jgi:hypothetical protein